MADGSKEEQKEEDEIFVNIERKAEGLYNIKKSTTLTSSNPLSRSSSRSSSEMSCDDEMRDDHIERKELRQALLMS